jgi:hypothetical protein
MFKKTIQFFITLILLSSGVKSQIINEACPFDNGPTVAFNRGSVALTKASKAVLDSFVNYLIYNPTCFVKIVGGKDRSNRKLVKKRLGTVIEHLGNKGVKRERFIITYSVSLPTTRITFTKAS